MTCNGRTRISHEKQPLRKLHTGPKTARVHANSNCIYLYEFTFSVPIPLELIKRISQQKHNYNRLTKTILVLVSYSYFSLQAPSVQSKSQRKNFVNKHHNLSVLSLQTLLTQDQREFCFQFCRRFSVFSIYPLFLSLNKLFTV